MRMTFTVNRKKETATKKANHAALLPTIVNQNAFLLYSSAIRGKNQPKNVGFRHHTQKFFISNSV